MAQLGNWQLIQKVSCPKCMGREFEFLGFRPTRGVLENYTKTVNDEEVEFGGAMWFSKLTCRSCKHVLFDNDDEAAIELNRGVPMVPSDLEQN